MAKKEPDVETDLLPPRRGGRRALMRLSQWYGLVIIVFVGVWWFITALPPKPGADPHDALQGFGRLLPIGEMLDRVGTTAESWVEALFYMVASVVLVVPVAFVYVRTRTRVKYDHSLVQTVIMLPIAVTAILMMVRDSLALAFSLAGVVAAVRFRNNLKESGDSVYIFTAIAIGFAAGVQSLGIALILSLMFCTLELALWYWDITDPNGLEARKICTMGETPAAPSSNPVRRLLERIGHDSGWSAMATPLPVPPDATTIAIVDAAIDVPTVELRIKVQWLLIEATDLDAAHLAAVDVLDEHAKRYTLLRRETVDGRTGTLEYEVRLRKKVGADELGDRIRDRADSVIRSLQWRSTPSPGALPAPIAE